uniref:Uncharacterized protein n=1 Tax=Romanomermis culicivorax TaxID=13658 RepID=A0A915K7T2_ROMCU
MDNDFVGEDIEDQNYEGQVQENENDDAQEAERRAIIMHIMQTLPVFVVLFFAHRGLCQWSKR